MIAVKLKGGFANQLFQYAAGRAVAKMHGAELFLDLSYLEQDPRGGYTKRDFELGQVKFHAKIADKNMLRLFDKKSFIDKALNKLKVGKFLVFNEIASTKPGDLEKISGNVLLNGYWQDENY